MASIYDWSTTAASNTNATTGINWDEGQAPGTVNNSARATLAELAKLLADISGTLTGGGTANGITVTANCGFTSYANGRMIAFRAAADNTGAATLNVNAIGAKAIRKITSDGDVALAAADIQQDAVVSVLYNSSLNGGAGGWQLLNVAFDAALSAIADMTPTDGNFIVGNGTTWVAESGSTARTSLGADNAANLTTGTLPSARLSGSYTGLTGTGALNAGSITSGFGSIALGSSTFTTTGAVSTGALTGTTAIFTGQITATGSGQNIVVQSPNSNVGPAFIRFQDADGDNYGYLGMGGSGNNTISLARNIAGTIEIDAGSGGTVSVTGDTTINGTLTVTG